MYMDWDGCKSGNGSESGEGVETRAQAVLTGVKQWSYVEHTLQRQASR